MTAITRLGPGGYPITAPPPSAPISGVVAVTLGGVIISSAGAIIVDGALSQTLASIGLSSQGSITSTSTIDSFILFIL